MAAEDGEAFAQYALGFMYDIGRGVPQDHTEAARWYRMAAEQGGTGAQYQLGHMYRYGSGVTQDNLRAHTWYNRAAAQGYERAEDRRTMLERRMTPDQIARAQELA